MAGGGKLAQEREMLGRRTVSGGVAVWWEAVPVEAANGQVLATVAAALPRKLKSWMHAPMPPSKSQTTEAVEGASKEDRPQDGMGEITKPKGSAHFNNKLWCPMHKLLNMG